MTADTPLRSLDPLDLASFRPHCDEAFECTDEHGIALTLRLASAEDLGSTPRQEQFSLIFHGPEAPALEQGLYQLAHPQLGRFLLFLVPLQPGRAARPYQAIFNRLKD